LRWNTKTDLTPPTATTSSPDRGGPGFERYAGRFGMASSPARATTERSGHVFLGDSGSKDHDRGRLRKGRDLGAIYGRKPLRGRASPYDVMSSMKSLKATGFSGNLLPDSPLFIDQLVRKPSTQTWIRRRVFPVLIHRSQSSNNLFSEGHKSMCLINTRTLSQGEISHSWILTAAKSSKSMV
jgi:hypothetical protein